MKKVLLLLWIVFFGVKDVGASPRFGLHFDEAGNVVKPDREFLARGLDDEKDGFRKSALKNFVRSASYGNHYAMSLVGLYHLQDKEYIKSLAWFKLVDMSELDNKDYVEDIIFKLENYLKKDDLEQVKKLNTELAETYGSYPTLLKREEWRNNLKFTGTRIRGHIPIGLSFNLGNGVSVSGFDVKNQVEDFVYEYNFNFSDGEVILNEVELIDVSETEPEQ